MVSRCGDSRWRGRLESRREITNRRLDAHIKTTWAKSKGRFESPRIMDELSEMGFPVSKNLVARKIKRWLSLDRPEVSGKKL